MQMPKRALIILSDQFAVCRLSPDADIPAWSQNAKFFSITRSKDELSVVCLGKDVPGNILAECGWRALKVKGALDFSLTGILASITNPLAKAKIPVFVISTYDTDYIFVRENHLSQAISVLSKEGHSIIFQVQP
jgi:hypothetical protein